MSGNPSRSRPSQVQAPRAWLKSVWEGRSCVRRANSLRGIRGTCRVGGEVELRMALRIQNPDGVEASAQLRGPLWFPLVLRRVSLAASSWSAMSKTALPPTQLKTRAEAADHQQTSIPQAGPGAWVWDQAPPGHAWFPLSCPPQEDTPR